MSDFPAGFVPDQPAPGGATGTFPPGFVPDEDPRKARLRAHLAEIEAKQAAAAAEPGPSLIHELGGGFYERGRALVRGLAAVGAHPIAAFADPARRHELERGVDDAVTLGYGRKAADYLSRDVLGSKDPTFAETDAAERASAPDVRTAGQLAGAFIPGVSNYVGKTAFGAAGGLTTSAPLRAAVAYEAAAPALAAAHADSAGHRGEAAAAAATDPAGAPLAALTGLLGQAVSNRIKNTRGYEARKLIEEKGQGARVGVTSPGEGGVFDRELADVPLDSRGEGIAAKRGAQNILEGLDAEHQAETSKPYKVMKAQIDNSSAATQSRDVSPILDHMQDALGNLGTDDSVAAKLAHKAAQLEKFRQPPDPADVKAATQEWYKLPANERKAMPLEKYLGENVKGPVMVPEDQLNDLRRSLMRMAKVGMTDAPGEKEAPLRAAAFAAKQMVDQGPYAPLNELYAEGAQNMRDSRQQLALKPRASADSAVDLRKLKLTLLRSAQNTNTAGGDADLEAFRAGRPNLAAQVDLPSLARARAELAFRLGGAQHGGLFDRLPHAGGIPAVGAGMALAHNPLTAAGGAATYLLGNNATPIAGRLLAPMADAPGTINPLRSVTPEQDPNQAARMRMIRALMGGSP